MAVATFPHEVDHIIAQKHGGPTTLDNLALSCFSCNRHKGSNIAAIDPKTGVIVRLFNPRTDGWSDHFEVRGGWILGKTSIGTATVRLLNMNTPDRIRERLVLIRLGII